MDLYILFSAFARLLLFLIIHFIVFRKINKRKIVKWIIYVYLASALLSVIVEWWLAYKLVGRDLFIAQIISLGVYTFLVGLYVMGILGLMVSSLRVRLLSEIVHRGTRGISFEKLLKLYNKKVIIRKRLQRLVSANEIRYENGKFFPHKKLSVFLIHEFLLSSLRRLYI